MGTFADYESYDGLGLAELVRARRIDPKDPLAAAIARVEARDPSVNAVVIRLCEIAGVAISIAAASCREICL